jgi:tellurite resistance protein TehA-like permease
VENGIQVMLFLGGSAALFFLLSKVFGTLGKSKTKAETIAAGILLPAVVVAFVAIFGISFGDSIPPWEGARRR